MIPGLVGLLENIFFAVGQELVVLMITLNETEVGAMAETCAISVQKPTLQKLAVQRVFVIKPDTSENR